MESMAYHGDSGSGAILEKDGQKYIFGVKSHGEGAEWGSRHWYTYTGGPALEWIKANMYRDPSIDPYVSAQNYKCTWWMFWDFDKISPGFTSNGLVIGSNLDEPDFRPFYREVREYGFFEN